MSQLQIELDKIEEQLVQLPVTVKKSRIKIAQQAAIAYELLNTTSRLNGLQNPYYDHIKRYGRQRALIVEGTTSRLNPYNINPSSDWIGNSDSFSFPTNDSFIFYCFDEDGIPITFDDQSMYLLENDQGELAGRFAIGLFLRDQADQSIPAYTTSSVVAGGVSHDKVTFATPFSEMFVIGQQYALMQSGDNIGYIEIGIEGLYQSPTWDPFKVVDFDNQPEIDQWVSEMMDMNDADFESIAGELVNGGIPEDDVLISADPTIRSASKKPYSSNIERSPFFPALNATESDWPIDFDTIDIINRKFTINGVDQWAVHPKFRWENRLVPSLSSDPNSEQLPGTFLARQYMNQIDTMTVSSNEFPVNDYSDELNNITYAWYEIDDLVKVASGTGGNSDCAYNTVTDIISEYDTNLGPLLNTIESDFSGFSDQITGSHQTENDTFASFINTIQSKMNAVKTYHGTWFDPVDDGDTSKFNDFLGNYNRTNINDFLSYISNNLNEFQSRVTQLESFIGNVENRTGYVGEVMSAVDALINRSFGVTYSAERAIKSSESITDLAVLTRKKYDGLNG